MNIFHVFCSNLENEPRLVKSISANLFRTSKLYVLGVNSDLGIMKTLENDLIKIKRFSNRLLYLPKVKNIAFLRYITWYFKIFIFSLNKKIDVIHSHSIEDLPICYILSIVKNSKLLYEPHELETERKGWFGVNKKLAKYVESTLLSKIDKCVVVNESIKS